MAHLWTEDAEGKGWAVAPLLGSAYGVSGQGLSLVDDRDRGPDGLSPSALLVRGDSGSLEQWLLLARKRGNVQVNGSPLVLGVRLLCDRDELVVRADGASAALRCFFSAERLAEVVAYPGGDGAVRCPRCKQPMERNQMAVRCPQRQLRRLAPSRSRRCHVGRILPPVPCATGPRNWTRASAGRRRNFNVTSTATTARQLPSQDRAACRRGQYRFRPGAAAGAWRTSERFCSSITDIYEVKNLSCQDISAGDVGRRKAVGSSAIACAESSRRSTLGRFALASRTCRLACMRVDAIVSCLDSRTSRRYVNQAAWRLGVPWIDGAVDASGLLARVNAYVPGPEAPCMECGWEDADYDTAALEQPYPCQHGGGGPAATNAPASLGHIAAGLMAIECQKLLAGDRESLLAGRQVMLDLRHHTHYVTTFRRGHCRFDHEIWHVEHLDDSPAKMTLGQAVHLSAGGSGSSSGCALRIEGQQFATMQFCPGCGHHEAIALHLADRIPSVRRRCTACGKTMTVRGFDRREWLDSQDAERSGPCPPALLSRC